MDRLVHLMEILLIEDSKFDVELTQEVFRQAKINNNLNIIANGDEAEDYILQREQHMRALTPDIILLDMNLPGKDGHELFEIIRQHPPLAQVPVIILVGSEAEKEILSKELPYQAYYIVKPISFSALIDALQSMSEFGVALLRALPVFEQKYAS